MISKFPPIKTITNQDGSITELTILDLYKDCVNLPNERLNATELLAKYF